MPQLQIMKPNDTVETINVLYEVGSLVKLKSDSPVMVVSAYSPLVTPVRVGSDIELKFVVEYKCLWICNGELRDAVIRQECLRALET